MSTIEDRLRDAMAAKAESVRDDVRLRTPPPPRAPSFGAGWWMPVAVAAAIVIVVAATVTGTRAVTPPAPAVQPTPYVGPLAAPFRQVWPDVVHEIPTTGPGGRTFKPDVFVTDRVVVGRGLTKNRLDGIWSYDVDKRKFTRIASLKDLHVMNAPLVFGDGYLAWSAFRDRMTEIWAVPVTGGVPRRIASITGVLTSDNSYTGIDLAIAGGMAVWSPSDGGVYRVPLKGGKASLINGTRGHYLVEWPWAGWPTSDMAVDYLVARPMEHLKNVLTGESRNAVPPKGRTSWNACGVTWCFNNTETWRRDGTDPRRLPGTARGKLYSGRFILLHQKDHDGRKGSSLHDLATGRTGLLFQTQRRHGEKPAPTLYLQEGMLWFRTGQGTQVLVNMNAISR